MIKSYTTQFLAIGLIAMMSCKSSTTTDDKSTAKKDNPEKSDFPKVIDVDTFLKNTDFVVSPDKTFPENKNIVYTPTLIAAWDTLVKGTKNQLVMTSYGEDYLLLEKGRKYITALDAKDYTATYKEFRRAKIITTASFKKLLPFKIPFVQTQDLAFKQKPIQSFGMKHTIEGMYEYLNVDYYKSNTDFIISITPADSTQEIILVKGDKTSQNFTAVMKRIEDLRKVSAKSKNYTDHISDEPLKIPKIIFNLKKNFQSLVDQSFDYDDLPWGIDTARQRTAFILDEKGAKVESEAKIVATPRGAAAVSPREFIFDTDFYIILRDKRKTYPYFGLKIVDDELLVK